MTATVSMVEVAMPRLSDSMEEGVIVSWKAEHGAEVEAGQVITEIETDKATMEYEAEAAGALEIVAVEGETVPVGGLIARLHPGGLPDELPAREPAEPKAAQPATEPAEPKVAGRRPEAPPQAPGERIRATPLARRIAAEHGLDLGSLATSGRRGLVAKADVLAALESAPPAPAPASGGKGEVEVETLSRLQERIARRMSESSATVPDFQVEVIAEVDAALEVREQLRALAERPPSINDMVVKAAALALREHPRANGSYVDGRFELHSEVNVGIAVAAPDGLLVPVIRAADQLGLQAIAAESRRMAELAREGRITPPDLAAGTFTVSNLGMFGVTRFTAVVNPPQAAILAVGAVTEDAVVRAGQVVPARRMALTLSADHRILYGADAASFLARVRELLENPLRLLI